MDHKMKVGVIGLGSMGFGMAQSVLRAGHQTLGVDINPDVTSKFQSEGGLESELFDVASQLDAIVVVVLNAHQTEAVLFGENGVVSQLKNNAVVISCATVPPDFAKKMEQRCVAAGVLYLDAPISGGSLKAAQGKLSIMASGSEAAFSAADPILSACAETTFRLGDHAGPGSAMKVANQLLAGVHIATMAEAITFAMTQGISPKTFSEVIPQCAGTSWMLENRAPHIVEGDYTPHSAVDIWPKDLGIVMEIANGLGFDAPIADAALQQFRAASDAGFGKEDDAAVAKIYAQKSGIELPKPKSDN